MLLGDLTRRPLADILGGAAAWALRQAWVDGDPSRHCCDHCHAARIHTCSPYFRDDVVTRYVDRSFERGEGAARRVRTEPFPVTRLEVQIDSRCQLACGFCKRDYAPTGAPDLRRHGSMDPLLFERLLDQVIALGGEGAELYTHWTGEPLLHPQRERIYRAISDRPFFTATLVTNGVALTDEFVDFLVQLPRPPAVYVSLHAATREAFRRTTGADRFERVQRQVETLIRRRTEAGREGDLRILVGYTAAPTNVDDLPRFLESWSRVFCERDQPPAIHLNGRGPMRRNVLIVVADGLDPLGDAMRRAFWTVEEALAGQEPGLAAVEGFAGSDAWEELPDPIPVFFDHIARVEQRLMYATDPAATDRERDLVEALLLRQARCETAIRGRVSDQTAGRLLAGLRGRPGSHGDQARALRRRAQRLGLVFGERAGAELFSAVDLQ